jgi:hypothetical protein
MTSFKKMDEFLQMAQLEILALVKSNYKGRVTFKKGQINLLGANDNTTANTIALLRKELSDLDHSKGSSSVL